MNNKDTIIFDLDGTLLNTLDDLTTSANYAMEQMGFPSRTKAEIKSFVGNGILVLIQKCVPAHTDDETIQKALDVFRSHYKIHCNDATRPYQGIYELLAILKENGIKMAIVSNKADFAVKELAEIYFSGIIPVAIGEMESAGIRKKPAPDTVLKAVQQLNSQVIHSVYVGDSEVDIKTAENAGMDMILCSWGFRDEEYLKSMGAQNIIHSPEELADIIL